MTTQEEEATRMFGVCLLDASTGEITAGSFYDDAMLSKVGKSENRTNPSKICWEFWINSTLDGNDSTPDTAPWGSPWGTRGRIRQVRRGGGGNSKRFSRLQAKLFYQIVIAYDFMYASFTDDNYLIALTLRFGLASENLQRLLKSSLNTPVCGDKRKTWKTVKESLVRDVHIFRSSSSIIIVWMQKTTGKLRQSITVLAHYCPQKG